MSINNTNQFSGAGVLIIENGENLVLFGSKRKSGYVYEDLGGKIDKNDCNITSTAIREAFEESRGLIYIGNQSKLESLYVDIASKNKYYRCFILPISDLNILNKYYDNVNKINSNVKIQNYWKETDDIRKFNINNLIKEGILDSKSNFKTIDINNKKSFIYDRTISIIKEIHKQKLLNKINQIPFQMINIETTIFV